MYRQHIHRLLLWYVSVISTTIVRSSVHAVTSCSWVSLSSAKSELLRRIEVNGRLILYKTPKILSRASECWGPIWYRLVPA